LRAFAKLEREVTVTGQFDHLEIWDKETFEQHDAEGQAAIVGGEGINDFM
jgi:DNA-binding transcriptional regulator/RsmH inhibitor MraZ